MEFLNKGVIVTGGNHGIGKQICLDYLAAGATVCMVDSNEELDQYLKCEKLFFYNGDVANKEVLVSFIQFCKEKLETIDILINNACVGSKGILSDCSYEMFDRTLAIGLKAPYELSRLCKEELIKNKGKIVNIASSRAFQSQKDGEAYASAKGGIVALTHALSNSLSPYVQVNAIAPGWIDVEETEVFDCLDEQSIPVGRVGKPKDISEAVLFITSQKASFLTGETIVIDGGMSKQMIYHNDEGWLFQGK
ncbi:SDR family oxidoreductase [Tannockella kyphosi]|uniref:SDR family oxidoreductase n=1 Tax=Tannockella kyphosi TaxID=2899121 RepID=UPI0020118247|nr:SDR family oxidoreductase [Tannockella kyphosi]